MSETSYLAGLRRSLWASLPALLVSSVVVSAGGVAAELVAPGLTPVAALVWGFGVAPLFGGLVAQTADVVLGNEPATLSYPLYLRRAFRGALVAGGVPGVAASVFLVALLAWSHGVVPALVPLAASGTLVTLASIAGLVGFTVSLRLPGLRGWPLVLFALNVVARRPVPVVGALAVVVLGVFAGVEWSASLLFLLPAPLAVVVVVAAWTSAAVSERWPDRAVA